MWVWLIRFRLELTKRLHYLFSAILKISSMGTTCAKFGSNDAADGPTANHGDMNKRDAISVDDARRRRAAFDSIVLSARNALQQMERYGEEFVTSRFGTSLAAHHMEWMEQRYCPLQNWLTDRFQQRALCSLGIRGSCRPRTCQRT